MARPQVPPPGTNEYLWWSQGAADEHALRNEGLSPGAREIRDFLEATACLRPTDSQSELVFSLCFVFMASRDLRRLRRFRRRWRRNSESPPKKDRPPCPT